MKILYKKRHLPTSLPVSRQSSIPTALARIRGLQADPQTLAEARAHIQRPCKTSAGQAVRRLALMGREVSEDCQPASAALLHSVNPLPSITRSARLNKQMSGNLDTVYHTQ